uniref:Protein kinase domain-containing protein n=1 Tax=Dracunculus medinensis TaxID=318479 RepID=A0A0N4U552_DRAME
LTRRSIQFAWSKAYSSKRDFYRELLFLCRQKEFYKWNLGKKVLDLKGAIKLGEGCFGEVFLVHVNGKEAALKIIPIAGEQVVNGEKQKSFRDILPEVVLSQELSDLHIIEDGNSTVFYWTIIVFFMVLKRRYPRELLNAWKKYRAEFGSENDCPDIFGSEQYFLLIAYENGGVDLEKFQVYSQAYSIVYQTIVSLIVAENRLCFEHRDLHCGNLLVRSVSQKAIRMYHILWILITLLPGSTTIYLNLKNDLELFEGQGDLQFDIYRLMRRANKKFFLSIL